MRVPVTRIDREVAQLASEYTCEPVERCLQFLTAIADEKLLIPGSVVAWIVAAVKNTKSNKYTHPVTTLIVITALDHLSKHLFDQKGRTGFGNATVNVVFRGRQVNTIHFRLVTPCDLGQRHERCRERILRAGCYFVLW